MTESQLMQAFYVSILSLSHTQYHSKGVFPRQRHRLPLLSASRPRNVTTDRFHEDVSVTVRRYRHRRDKITARSSVSTPQSPLIVRISDGDGDGAANGVETDDILKPGSEQRDFSGRYILKF